MTLERGITCENCKGVYIGETGRALKVRLAEHKKSVNDKDKKSAVGEHTDNTVINFDSVKVLQQESGFWDRKIKEALQIKKKKPILNMDGGFEISKIYNLILNSTN